MTLKYLAYLIAALSATTLTACGSSDSNDNNDDGGAVITDTDSDGVADASDNCPDDANADQTDSDANGEGDACDALPTQYTFTSQLEGFDGDDAVSYTGQTTRQVLVADLLTTVKGLTETNGQTSEEVKETLMFYVNGNVDDVNYLFSIDDETVTPSPTYADISTGKTLAGKIAGGDGQGGGETEKLIDDAFFGWEEGMDGSPLPIELLEHYITTVAGLATDGVAVSIDTATGVVTDDDVTVDQYGRDYDQLIQKFALGAVVFSQGTNDYLSTDFAAKNTQKDDKSYTSAEHAWDEGFGYFGAARDYNDYTDLEIRAKDGRDDYKNGYHDTNGDGLIDLRSEINLANSTNCAKRDLGATVATDYTKETFDAFVLGRQVLNNAAASTDGMTEAQQTILTEQTNIAAVTWEKCIAATVVHYINDVTGDMDNFTAEGKFADSDNFLDLSKHWSEMKGFALGLQFSPYSPFRTGDVADIDVDDLKDVLSWMGDAPVLADGTQMGTAFTGGVDQYKADLLKARDTLQQAYEFHADNVANW